MINLGQENNDGPELFKSYRSEHNLQEDKFMSPRTPDPRTKSSIVAESGKTTSRTTDSGREWED